MKVDMRRCLLTGLLGCCLFYTGAGVALEWSELSTEQQQLLAPLQEHWLELEPWQQEKALKHASRFLELSPEQRERAKRRFERWQAMTPEQREEMRLRFQRFRDLSPEQRQRLRKLHHRWRDLPPQEQQELTEQWRHRPGGMGTEPRQGTFDLSEEQQTELQRLWDGMSPEQRRYMRHLMHETPPPERMGRHQRNPDQ